MNENVTLLFKLFESRIPRESFSPAEIKRWRKAIEEELIGFESNKVENELRKIVSKSFPTDLRYNFLKYSRFSAVKSTKEPKASFLEQINNFGPQMLIPVQLKVRSHLPSQETIEREKDFIENENFKYWPRGVNLSGESDTQLTDGDAV